MNIELDDDVPFGDPPNKIQPYQQPAITEVEQSRAEAETQAGFLVAQRFPRNEQRSIERIIRSCRRKSLAEVAEYAFPRGGQQITGPSIRPAEVIAQSWGNMAVGIRELQTGDGVSMMLAYAYDLETNLRNERIFAVKHERKAAGVTSKLTDARDIYEMTANQGARRLRACILAVIPGDVVEAAVEACRATLDREEGPIEERIPKMLEAFAKVGVTKEMIEARFEKKAEALLPADLSVLRRIFTGIADGISEVKDWFKKDTTEQLKDKLKQAGGAGKPPKSDKAKKAPPQPAAAPEPAPEPEPAQPDAPPPDEPTEPPSPEGPPEPPELPEPPEPPEPAGTVPTGDDAHIVAKATLQQKAGRRSQWQEQYEGRFARGVKLIAAITGEDGKLEMAKAVLELLRPFKAKDIDDLQLGDRLAFRKALDEMLQGLEKAAEEAEA